MNKPQRTSVIVGSLGQVNVIVTPTENGEFRCEFNRNVVNPIDRSECVDGLGIGETVEGAKAAYVTDVLRLCHEYMAGR